MPGSHRTALLLICLIWAGNFLASAIAVDHLPPVTVTAMRFAVVLTLLFPFLKQPQAGEIEREMNREFRTGLGDPLQTGPAINQARNNAMKPILIAAAAGLMLSSLQAQAGPSRAELLAGQQYGQDRYHQRSQQHHHRATRHRSSDYVQHRYDNARRYAANAVRQAREIRHLGYYPDHPRWSTNFQRHFEWALRADAWKLEREARKRAYKLRELRRYARYEYGYPH